MIALDKAELGGATLLVTDAIASPDGCNSCEEEVGCVCIWGGYDNGWWRCIYHCAS